MYSSFCKRIFDFSFSLIGFILLSPLFILTAFCLFITNNGHPFFIQERPGKDGRIFKIIKFKTMNERKDAQGNLLSDAERLTKIGRFIRKTSFDEVPQLLNVIKGDMSLIGPRPLLPQYLPLYNDFQKRRHEVRPGITGWAQVNGRNALSWDEKFKFDVEYVQRISFLFDLKILFLTIRKVFVREGIAQSGQATMEVFKGNNKQ